MRLPKQTILAVVLAAAAVGNVHAQSIVIPPGKLAVFKGGDNTGIWNISTSRVQPCFVQIYDPIATNQSSPLVSVAMSTNAGVPGSVWINDHAGSEGGGISRSSDRQFLALEGYTGDILSPTNAKPSTDPTVFRGIVTLDAFTNAVDVYSDLVNWFGIPIGAPGGTQDNPTGIASTDGTNFWGTGNFAGTSSELDGTLFFTASQNDGQPVELQNYIQAAAEARIIGGTLYVVVPGGGVYNFVDPEDNNALVPLPWDPNVANPVEHPVLTNLFINWGTTFKNIANFDMNPSGTMAYGADQTFGIVKFVNTNGVWTQAPYYFSATNIGTIKQKAATQGCFGICVDFSGTNPIIYATTMETGTSPVNNSQGNPNQNRIICIVDGGNPGTNLVAQTLATAGSTNETFRGIDFSPDLRPLITSEPADYATIDGGSATFAVAADSVFTASYQWLQNSIALNGATNASLALNSLTTDTNGFTYQCVVANQYGSVTSTPAILTVTVTAQPPVISGGANNVTGFVNSRTTFPPVSPTGTQPFTFQWYKNTTQLADDGVKYSGSTSSSLSISNLTTADSGNYYLVVMNSAGSASNLVDVLTVNYHLATITAGEPQSVTTFVGLTTSLTATETGATPPVTYRWYRGTTALTDAGEFSGSTSPTLMISPAGTNDSGTNYYIVVTNPGGSVTSQVARVTVTIPPPPSYVGYSNQVYVQNFNSLPDPGISSVNSINNLQDPGSIAGVAYSLANPFDFTYPVITTSYVGGLGLSNTMPGWYGAADTLYQGVDGITRFGAQDGDQTTGGVIDFGPNDGNGITGTNRALGLLSTSTTGSTTFALKLINQSGNALNYIALSFVGELWHNGTGTRTLSFGYTLDDTATNFVLTSQSISNSTLVSDLAFSFPTAIVVTTVDGTQPTNQTHLGVFNLPLSPAWPSGSALWLIWSIDYYGSGAGNGYAIDNLAFSASITPQAPALSIQQDGSNVIASWPQAVTGYTLAGNTDLTKPGGWVDLGLPVVVTNGFNTVTVPMSGSTRFFRLHQ